jgi:hypothetical protein
LPSDISNIQILATVCFGLAVLHTFLVKIFQEMARKYREGSVGENLFHMLGEVEVVFGLWAGILIFGFLILQGQEKTLAYIQARNFTEPAFVFVIMACCSTRPILQLAEKLILFCSRILPLKPAMAFYASALTIGPLLGSFITEPAAMTITALLLLKRFYRDSVSEPLKYATLGLLFVNVSIGGTLTPFAAPPVLMVAETWAWDLSFMLKNFGWRAVLAVCLSTGVTMLYFARPMGRLKLEPKSKADAVQIPIWALLTHLILLGLIVRSSHHIEIFIGVFLFYLGLVTVTKEYQEELKLRESLMVAFFLGGLVVLGGMQSWWLQPILNSLSVLPLYFGTIALTAVTDNAALTYLGSQVEGLSDVSKYALVAGSVVGGGLTVIANAPNPAGYGILNRAFGENGISPLKLLLGALLPTLIAALAFFPWG